MAAKYLARSNSRVVCIFGTGQLGRSHLEGLAQVFDLKQARIVDTLPAAAAEYAEEMSAKLDLPVVVPKTPETAVRHADIVVTVTTGNGPLVHATWLKSGAFLAKIGSFQELETSLLTSVDKVIVDSWYYASLRVPELSTLCRRGEFSDDDVHVELLDIVSGRAPGRESNREVIVYVAPGIGGEYAAILPHVYRRAVELNLGVQLPLSLS